MVANAGIIISKTLLKLDIDDWNKTLAVGYTSVRLVIMRFYI